MSIEARRRIVNSTNAYFQSDSQKSDILDIHCVRTETIALILELMQKGHILEFTAIKSDHHDDSALGPYCHFKGAAFDCWPLIHHAAPGPQTWAEATSPQMTTLIRDIFASKYTKQCGLAGSADNDVLLAVAGYVAYPEDGRLFRDDGDDHIHVGAIYPMEVGIL